MDALQSFKTYRTPKSASTAKPKPAIKYHMRPNYENSSMKPQSAHSSSSSADYGNYTGAGNLAWRNYKNYPNSNFKSGHYRAHSSTPMTNTNPALNAHTTHKRQGSEPYSSLPSQQEFDKSQYTSALGRSAAFKPPKNPESKIKLHSMRQKPHLTSSIGKRSSKVPNHSPLEPRYDAALSKWKTEYNTNISPYYYDTPVAYADPDYLPYTKRYDPRLPQWSGYQHQKNQLYYQQHRDTSNVSKSPYDDRYSLSIRTSIPKISSHSRQVSEILPPAKVTKSKPRHRKNKSRSSKLSISMKDFGPSDHSNLLITPTFVPGMPMNSGHIGPPVHEHPPGGYYWSIISKENDSDSGYDSRDRVGYIALPIQMCEPPLRNIVPAYPHALDADPQPRNRKQSKYTPEQDELILKLKNEGKSWAEIATKVRCQNQLAARNRYQVLIGQQGGGTFFWSAEDCAAFQAKLDECERAKWLFIAEELSKKHGRHYTIDMVHYRVCKMFAEHSERFGVLKTKDPSHGGAPYKRKLLYSH